SSTLLRSYLTLACNLVPTGYANEVGEAFRALVPVSAVWATHAVATVYVSADALDKGKKAGCWFKSPSRQGGKICRSLQRWWTCFVWQALASVAIPGFTINRVCAASLYLLGRTRHLPLSTIPFIIHPIDRSVVYLGTFAIRCLWPKCAKVLVCS
uniref:Mitochondrial fission process protein 1 n=1 Tax=Salmo trutta TaxID=8032 RepID=A0A673YGK5_SALTR